MKLPLFIFLNTLATLVDGAAIYKAHWGGHVLWFLLPHLCMNFFIFISMHYHRRTYQNPVLTYFTLFLALLFPVLGPIAAIVFFLFLRNLQNTVLSGELNQTDVRLADTITDLKIVELGSRKSSFGSPSKSETNIQSFLEILSNQAPHQQRSVVSILQRSRNPENVRLLQGAQNHHAPEIIQMASAALSEMEAEWFEEIKLIEDQIATDPSNLSLRCEVMRQYILLYESHLLVTGVAPFYMVHAIEHVRATTPLALNDAGALQMIGQVLLIANQKELALKILTRALELSKRPNTIRSWLAEAHFDMGNYSLAKDELHKIAPEGLKEKIREVVQSWN